MRRLKNRFAVPTLHGYRDLLFTVWVEPEPGFAHLCEVQVHLQALLAFSNQFHLPEVPSVLGHGARLSLLCSSHITPRRTGAGRGCCCILAAACRESPEPARGGERGDDTRQRAVGPTRSEPPAAGEVR